MGVLDLFLVMGAI